MLTKVMTMAAVMFGTGPALAQDATSQTTGSQPFDVVYIDVGGAAVQVPLALAAQACALATEEIQRTAQMRLDDQGLMPSDVGITPAASSADTSGATATGTGTEAANTTQTADANTATAAGNATTQAGNTTADTAQAGAPADATASEQASQMASAGHAAATGAGDVENIQPTAAEATAAADDASADADQAQDPFLVLAVCTIEPTQAASFGIDTTRTGQSLGLDASSLQAPGAADQ